MFDRRPCAVYHTEWCCKNGLAHISTSLSLRPTFSRSRSFLLCFTVRLSPENVTTVAAGLLLKFLRCVSPDVSCWVGQSCLWVGLTHGLGLVGSGWVTQMDPWTTLG